MFQKMRIIITILFIISALNLFSQSSGSLYSAYGIGTIKPAAVGILEGLGTTGIGLRSPYFINTVNPAANVFMQTPTTMMLDAGIYTEATYARNSQGSALQGGGGISHLVMWMQPNPYWGTALGLMPYSEMKYNITATRYNEVLGTNYDVVYKGEGGLNRFFWSNAFNPIKNLSIGVNVSFLFGAIERTENFTSATNILEDFSTDTKTNFADMLLETGIQYGFRINGNSLVLGATFQPASKMASNEKRHLYNENGATIQENDQPDAGYRLPMHSGFGVSWNTKRLSLASDIMFEQWADAELNTENELNNTLKWSLGAEWALTEDSYLFYQKPLFIRSGFFIQNHHETVAGNSFLTWGFSLGASVPISRKLHHISFNYSFQQNGTQSNGLLLESTHRLTLNINLRDIWFQKRRFN